jgi:hypothetical protein
MPQVVVFGLALHAASLREHRASCFRFVVARTSRPFALAVNRRRSGAVLDRVFAFALRPMDTPGQAAGSAAGLGRRQLLRPSRLPSVFCAVFTSSLRSSRGRFPWAASAGILAPATLGRAHA